ncbi:Dual specificity protein kinase TTK-like protein [Aphelenchoides fujianensis]|nr:Dual specificity protein kinase TTK-like protein [Aphelenchoides fujianensis]
MLPSSASSIYSLETQEKLRAMKQRLKEPRARLRPQTSASSSNNDSGLPADPLPINSGSSHSALEPHTLKNETPVLPDVKPPSPPPPPAEFEVRTKKPLAELPNVPAKKRRASIIIEKPPKAAPVDDQRLKAGAKVVVNRRTYVVDSCIGSGGSCSVYKANDGRRDVALKVVDVSKADREAIKVFKNEIDFLRKLQSDDAHVIRMYDSQVTKDAIYVIMELGQQNLNDWIKNRTAKGRNNADMILFCWHEMVECVSPANFVFVNNDIKLIDFGIAAQIADDEQSVCRKHVQGTLSYISPEAVNCQPGGGGFEIPLKSDVWSLGCILYALHFGHAPFAVPKRSQEEKILAIRSEEVRYPEKPPMSPALEDVLRRCLTRNLNERLSVAEILDHPYITKKPLITDVKVRAALDAAVQHATPRTQMKLKSMLGRK